VWLQRFQRSRGVGRYIRENRGAIAADAGTDKALDADGQLVGHERDARTCAKAAEPNAVRKTSGRGERRSNGGTCGDVLETTIKVAVGGLAGIDGLMGEAGDGEEFIVAVAGIGGGFDEQIRRLVEGDVGQVGAGVDGFVDRNGDIGSAVHLVGVVDN
jgi:hypothetical protein